MVSTPIHFANLRRLSKWTSAFIAGWLSIKLLQSKKSEAYVENVYHETSEGRVLRPTHFAGRTLDLTVFAIMRALDVIVGELWSQRKIRRVATQKWNQASLHPYLALQGVTNERIARYNDRVIS